MIYQKSLKMGRLLHLTIPRYIRGAYACLMKLCV